MRTNLVQVAGGLLAPLLLVSCQETTTDPAAAGTANRTSATHAVNTATSSTAGTAVHFTAEGAFGQTYWTPNAGFFTCGFIEVSRTGSSSNAGVILWYYYTPCGIACDEGECPPPIEYGYGEIPAGDLTLAKRTVNGRQLSVVKLNTNTANDPNFFVYAGNGGQITVEWDRTPGLEFVSTGHSVTKLGTFTERVHGTSTAYSARATGSVVGIELPTTSDDPEVYQVSYIGSAHAKTIDISH